MKLLEKIFLKFDFYKSLMINKLFDFVRSDRSSTINDLLHLKSYEVDSLRYWDFISSLIFEASQKHGGKYFFQHQSVMLHLAAEDARLGESIYETIEKSDYGNRLLRFCRTPNWGGAYLLAKYPFYSSTTLSHVANICSIKENVSSVDEFDHFIEFGGGYGGLVLCLHQIGFSKDIIVVDKPSMQKAQVTYLKNTSPHLENVSFSSRLESLVLPGRAIFNASFSLSEIPLNERESILRYVMANCAAFHIIFQESFLDLNNADSFNYYHKIFSDNGWDCKLENYKYYDSNHCFLFSGLKV